MQINKKITVLTLFIAAVIFLFPHIVGAQADNFGINDLASGGVNLGTRPLRETIAGIVNIFLGFLGILATLIILYGGYTWMTAAGEKDKIDKAKKIIINGVIGLVIILTSYAIARFVITGSWRGIFTGGTGDENPIGYVGGVGVGGGALESHYPARNATDIPRNTNIYVTFKEPMDVGYIVTDTGCSVDCEARSGYIDIYEDGGDTAITGANLLVTYNPADPTVFQFNPYGNSLTDHLGRDNDEVKYRVDLGDLYTQAGTQAFPLKGGYSWYFTVSNVIDLTPPTVRSVQPVNASIDNSRNSIVQMNFSEAVNPMMAVGTYPGFTNITVSGLSGVLNGDYLISNQYQTVEFMTDTLCGENSCGQEVYCLPQDQVITGVVTNAIQDMAGNTLDCGTSCNGANYQWFFSTNNEIDLSAPQISSMQSATNASLVDPIEVTFNRPLLSSSINSDNIQLADSSGLINYETGLKDGNIVRIYHDKFDGLTDYWPTLNSSIKDNLQNCWYICQCSDPTGLSCQCTNNDPTIGTNCPGDNCATD